MHYLKMRTHKTDQIGMYNNIFYFLFYLYMKPKRPKHVADWYQDILIVQIQKCLIVVLLNNRTTGKVHSAYRQGYLLDGRGIRVRFLIGAEITVAPVVFRETLRPTKPPVKRVMGAVYPGPERSVLQADISFPSSTEIKYAWSCNSTAPINVQVLLIDQLIT
jgi:hypothetical protein